MGSSSTLSKSFEFGFARRRSIFRSLRRAMTGCARFVKLARRIAILESEGERQKNFGQKICQIFCPALSV
jgi:hypothetical protein